MDEITKEEYEELEALATKFAETPPVLSGKSGYFTQLRERALVNELLPSDYARVVNAKATAMSVSPAEVIKDALKSQFADVG